MPAPRIQRGPFRNVDRSAYWQPRGIFSRSSERVIQYAQPRKPRSSLRARTYFHTSIHRRIRARVRFRANVCVEERIRPCALLHDGAIHREDEPGTHVVHGTPVHERNRSRSASRCVADCQTRSLREFFLFYQLFWVENGFCILSFWNLVTVARVSLRKRIESKDKGPK